MVGDEKDLANQLEAMKMTQATLQQLMNLSAGGLGLFFTFISKATFISTVDLFGTSVVLSWITSLTSAAYAHKLHSEMFLSLANLNAAKKELLKLDSLYDEVVTELQVNPNKQAVIDRAKAKLTSNQSWAKVKLKEFEHSFFPNQNRALFLTRLSLLMLVSGFFMLALGYIVSTNGFLK